MIESTIDGQIRALVVIPVFLQAQKKLWQVFAVQDFPVSISSWVIQLLKFEGKTIHLL